jgi:hypothetical protein
VQWGGLITGQLRRKQPHPGDGGGPGRFRPPGACTECTDYSEIEKCLSVPMHRTLRNHPPATRLPRARNSPCPLHRMRQPTSAFFGTKPPPRPRTECSESSESSCRGLVPRQAGPDTPCPLQRNGTKQVRDLLATGGIRPRWNPRCTSGELPEVAFPVSCDLPQCLPGSPGFRCTRGEPDSLSDSEVACLRKCDQLPYVGRLLRLRRPSWRPTSC